MSKKFSVFVLLLSLVVSFAYAQQDKPSIPKGQLIPTPQIVRSARVVQLHEATASSVFEENFETGATSWSISRSWAIGAPTSGPNSGHASTNCAATNLTGNYPNDASDWLISPLISLPILTHPSAQMKLYFWEWFQMESEYDYGRVKISTNGGVSWTELSSRSGSSDWRQTTVDISSYADQTVKLGFHFTSDGSSAYSGWYVNNIQIILEEPEALEATLVGLNHQKFPFIYMNVAVDTFGVGFPGLAQSNFQVYENDILQTDYFELTPSDTGAGVRLTDIVFLMDNSGSMSGEINAVSNNVIDFVNNLASSGVNFALGLCRYGGSENGGNPIIEDNGILTTDANYFKNDVWARNHANGSHEPGYYAITQSSASFSFRPGAQKVFIIITDETPNQGGATLNDALSACINNSITLFALTKSKLYSTFEPITSATNGAYFDIYSNFDDILSYISSQVTNTYLVRYKSSNPLFDGTVRNVEVVVSYAGDVDTCRGSYVPGSAPIIQRTQATLDLHDRAWAEGTEFTIEADIVDNVAPYVQTATLYYKKTTASNYSSTSMSVYSGNTYRGTIPGSAVQTPGLDYYITATDGQNTASDPSVDPINNPYQFAILPNVAPVITHTPVTSLTPGTPITITAQIVDNTNSVASAKLYYRKAAQLTYQDVDMSNVGGDDYESVIPATYVTNDGVEYYLRAEDDFGVSGYYGTPDVPVSIRNPLFYVNEKEAIINYFLGENFYLNAEQDAQNFTDQVEQKINAGTATNKDIEALRRLSLVEEAAKVAYPGAVEIAQLSSKATIKASVALIFQAAFGTLQKVLEPYKNTFLIKYLYKGVKAVADSFGKLFGETLGRILGELTKKLVPKLMEMNPNMTEAAARALAQEIVRKLEIPIYKQLSKRGFEYLVSLTPLEDGIASVYLSIYEDGLPGGFLWVSGTEQAISDATSYATSQSFQEGNVNVVTQTIRNVKEPSISAGNTNVKNAINSKIDWGGILGLVAFGILVVSLLASIVAAIAGIPLGGVGAIPGLLGFLASLAGLAPFFSVAEIGSYGLGACQGLYQIHYTLPYQLNEVQQVAFDKTTSSEFGKRTSEGRSPMLFTAIPSHWADSLVVISNEVAQGMSEIKFLIQQGNWDEAGTKFELLWPKLEQLSSKQNIVNSVLDVSYFYNTSASVAGLDSIYHYTGAYTAANDIGLGFSQFAIGFALLVKPTGSELNTLFQILDESINRLQAVGPSYKQTFNQFNSWGFQTPPIVSIIDHSIDEGKVGYTVQAHIKNISNVSVHNVNASLKSSDSIGISVTAETDTVIPILNANEEKTFRWRVNYYGTEKIFILDLDVHPLVIPGDFQGDRKIISQFITEVSPPTRGTLDNKNIYAYPNPFNPDVEDVTLRFKLANPGNVTIKIYDVANRLVTSVISDFPMEADQELSVKWNGRNDNNQIVANGVYVYVIESSSGEKGVGKVAVLR